MDPSAHYRNVAAGYTEAIRNTDAKAFVGVLFTATMMATVVGYRSLYPAFLFVPLLVSPFLVIFFCLLFTVYPRFPRTGRAGFPLLHRAHPDVFLVALDSEGEKAELPMRCALLARILFWKSLSLQISYMIALVLIVMTQILLTYFYFFPSPPAPG
jgi:hypothetical protein